MRTHAGEEAGCEGRGDIGRGWPGGHLLYQAQLGLSLLVRHTGGHRTCLSGCGEGCLAHENKGPVTVFPSQRSLSARFWVNTCRFSPRFPSPGSRRGGGAFAVTGSSVGREAQALGEAQLAQQPHWTDGDTEAGSSGHTAGKPLGGGGHTGFQSPAAYRAGQRAHCSPWNGRPQAPARTSALRPLGDFSAHSALWRSAYEARKEGTLAPDLVLPLSQGFIHSLIQPSISQTFLHPTGD